MRPSLLLSVLMLVPACGMASSWVAAPEVVQGPSAGREIRGMVFEDRDGDGRRQPGEAGVAGVLVSNGLDVVRTDEQGGYVLPLREDMDLFVIQPSGWQVPVDERNVPRFSHTHKPGGSPVPLRFGGLADTGPAPAQVNFPLRRTSAARQRFTCAVIGDSQTYSNQEIEQFRDSAITDLLERDNGPNDCAIYLGDVVGDDLGLLPRLLQVGSVTGLPQWAVAGNHDVDFDAPDDAHSLDSWRRLWGPAYYAFEIGEVLFVALDNVVYPCNADDAARPGRESCANGRRPGYNARVTDTQMEWLSNLLEHTPRERLIVLLHHIPLVSYTSADSPIHQTDNAAQIHQLLKGRPALSLSGHTHTLENHDPGQHYAGWKEMVGLGPLPFRHIVAGAASGRWWQGDFGIDGTAMALTDLGEPKGVLMLDFDGIEYAERYVGSRLGERGQWIDLNTPSFRAWFKTLDAWRLERAAQRDPLPPVSINDLPDTRSFTRQELLEGVWITANFWHGSASSRVEASINGGPLITLARTQKGAGEESRRGAEYADPFAIKRQASIGRYAIQSRSGQERNQGWEGGRGSANRGVPQPSGWAERSTHLWRAALPTDLEEGVHTLRVTSTDRNGRRWSDVLTFEVRAEHPPRRHRRELWR
ncbi:calcineurin-like phosphoesterase C-terminal domain-containing protein [Luteimonas sp. e5]